MKTYSLRAKDIENQWQVVDATDQPLGRLASQVAMLLMGKHKPAYSPHLAMGDFIVVVNAEKVQATGKKLEDKVYYHHTGYMGGIKETTLTRMLAKHPERVIELAVRGMLPRNRLARKLLGRLKVYPGPNHPHQAQLLASQKRRESGEAPASAAATTSETEVEK
jgi:large subunit ribosomal protein L13